MTDEKYEKGELLSEGKTKWIYAVVGHFELVIIEYKDTITKFDDPSQTKTFKSKAELSNITNCKVFELLQKAGIPVAFVRQISPTEFVAKKCGMIGLEVVMRRFAVGSYLKRNPDLERPKGVSPYRFRRLVVEFFLKTTKGELKNKLGELLVHGLDPKKGEEDPLIPNPHEAIWKLYHPKKPKSFSEIDLGKTVQRKDVIGDNSSIVLEIMDFARQVFLVLEGAWNILRHRLIDMKIEFGVTKGGRLVVADVIDNDSWRLRTSDWKELSKEAFRQGEDLREVEKKYGIVASLVEQWK